MPIRTTALGVVATSSQIVSSVRQGLAIFRIGSSDSGSACVVTDGATAYALLDGLSAGDNASENTRNMTMTGVACTLTEVGVYVDTNAAGTANSSVQFRADGADKGTAVDITKSTTGRFVSSGLSESIAADDLISLKIVNGGGGNLGISGAYALFEWTGA